MNTRKIKVPQQAIQFLNEAERIVKEDPVTASEFEIDKSLSSIKEIYLKDKSSDDYNFALNILLARIEDYRCRDIVSVKSTIGAEL